MVRQVRQLPYPNFETIRNYKKWPKQLTCLYLSAMSHERLNHYMSNFAMGTILGKGFAQAQVHTNHSTSAEGTSAVMYARVCKDAQCIVD